MKALFALLVLVTTSSWAGSEPLRLAERLQYEVDSLSREAMEQANHNPDPRERRKFLELGEESDEVRQTIKMRIVRELENGTPIEEVARNFESVRSQLDYVKRLSQALRVIPPSIQRLMNDIQDTTRELYRALNGDFSGGISAQCKETTEWDALFGAKTKVDCSFHGKGLVKYEVILNFGSTNLSSHLYPELMDQHITTEKVKAGLWPKYEVYVTDRKGKRTLVAKN